MTSTTQFGRIEIAKEVIATIAGIAAVETYGLVGMVSRNISEGIAGLLGRDALSKGVQVFLEKAGEHGDLRFGVAHADDLITAEKIKSRLLAQFPEAEVVMSYIGPVVGIHAGPGTIVVRFCPQM